MSYIDEHAEATDLGSWVCVKVTRDHTYGDKQLREYFGLSSDISKLPKYEDLATGSNAYCVDNGNLYMYNAVSKTWVEQ